jgi:2-polyprenyl-6-methoxyphenol hydroxylase-like FAD-dependent oxidoreductase
MTRVLIIGGGIAGTLSALALRKAGIDSVVYEAYDRTADGVGAYLTLAVNALDALRALDLDGMVHELGFDTAGIRVTSGAGKTLAELPYGPALPDGTLSQTVKRADLYRALREEALRRSVVIEYGKRLVDAEVTGRGVLARFADRTTAEGDLLIGADGLRSRTREVIDPCAPGARYVGLLNTGGYAHGISVDSEPGTMNAIFGRRCFFAYTLNPNGEVWWAANPARASEPTAAELATITAEHWRAQLIELFRGDRGPAVDIIEASGEIFAGWNSYDFPSVPTWHNQRMIIVGDAAHATAPSIGQGVAMAVEDSVVLAKCLRDIPDTERAFATYEHLRRERVERVVAQGKRTGDWKTPGPVGRVLRDLIMRVALSLARTGDDPNRWIYEHHIDWDERIHMAG